MSPCEPYPLLPPCPPVRHVEDSAEYAPRTTIISDREADLVFPRHAQSGEVMAVFRRRGIVCLTLSTFDMWGAAGFLSRVFKPFARHSFSVDLVATSQYSVSVTLDDVPGGVDGDRFKELCAALQQVCRVEVQPTCAIVSVVGRKLRHSLARLGAAMNALEVRGGGGVVCDKVAAMTGVTSTTKSLDVACIRILCNEMAAHRTCSAVSLAQRSSSSLGGTVC